VAQSIHTHEFDNGLTLLAEEMPWLESAAFAFLMPAGAVHDPPDRLGLCNFLCDLVQRGAGPYSNREFVEALDGLGVDHNSSVSLSHTSYGGATLAENLLPAIELHAHMLQRPHLPEGQLEETRQVCFQELRAMEDDLAHRVVERTRQLQYPAPWGRSIQGVAADVEAITMDDVRAQFSRVYRPNSSILSVAGNLDWPRLRDRVGELFAAWPCQPVERIPEKPPSGTHDFIAHDSNQTHIAVSYPSVPYRHEDYYQARAAVGILSDGMSSRLFTEVREKEGLCYTIYASNHTLRDRGSVLCYSATSTERAQETLDISLRELKRLAEGVLPEELTRLKARIKSALIMQQESSSTRSVSMAIDWYHLGLVRRLDEVASRIDDLTAESISDYLVKNPPANFRIVSLGAQPLEVPVEIL
jgi:predicted Zn-dependent peptidase